MWRLLPPSLLPSIHPSIHPSNHPSIRSLADVAQKERNQDRLLGLALMASRYALLLWIGLDFERAWLVTIVLSSSHLVLNTMAARVLVLRTFNLERLRLVMFDWDAHKTIPTPADAARRETILPRCRRGSASAHGFQDVKMGVATADLLIAPAGQPPASTRQLHVVFKTHENRAYVLGACLRTSTMRVVLKKGAHDIDQVAAAWHALRVGQVLRRVAKEKTSPLLVEDIVCAIEAAEAVFEAEWSEVSFLMESRGFRTSWALLAASSSRVDVQMLSNPEMEGLVRFKVTELEPVPAGGWSHRELEFGDTELCKSKRAKSTRQTLTPHGAREGTWEGPKGKGGFLVGTFCSLVLPHGFPQTVAPEYLQYQLWDTLQVGGRVHPSIIVCGRVGGHVGHSHCCRLYNA